MSHDRRWWKAILLTCGLSGLGHLYAGRPRLALLIFASLNALLLPLCLLAFFGRSWALFVVMLAAASACGLLILIHAGLVAERAPKPYVLRPYNRWWIYLPLFLFGWFVWPHVVTTFIRHAFVQSFWMRSVSMAPTIQSGDYFFVDRRGSARGLPTRNQVMVFRSEDDPSEATVKRVVALPGDTIATRNGRLYRNGRLIEEPWTIPVGDTDATPLLDDTTTLARSFAAIGYRPTLSNWGPVVVPLGHVFVLGDNRPNSYDSRYYGPVGVKRFLGRPVWIYFNLTHDAAGYHTHWDRVGTSPWVVQPN